MKHTPPHPSSSRSLFPLATLALAIPAFAQGQWAPLPQANSPSPRQSARMMAYDMAADRIVLFGGDPASGNHLGDTQIFDCRTSAWTLATGGSSPLPRYGHSLTYDVSRNEVILFGGQLVNNNSSTFVQDTWSFSGNTWQRRYPASAPPARALHSAVYDSVRQVVVLFGGGWALMHSDTWEWDGANWVLRATTIPSGQTPARQNCGIAFDPVRNRTIIFGGRNGNSFYRGTFSWDGNTWADVTTPAAGSPVERAAASMVYDPAIDRIVMFGGNGASANLNDTWYWDGGSWAQVFPGNPPLARGNSGFVYDAQRERCVLFGGSSTAGYYNDLNALAPAVPARLQRYGQGCGGAVPAPVLGADGHRRPWLGDFYSLTVQGLPASGVVALTTGVSNQLWGATSLPMALGAFGMSGCLLLASPDVMTWAFHSGAIDFTITLPNLPAFVGYSLFHQALVLHPGAANPAGALVSNGMEAALGVR